MLGDVLGHFTEEKDYGELIGEYLKKTVHTGEETFGWTGDFKGLRVSALSGVCERLAYFIYQHGHPAFVHGRFIPDNLRMDVGSFIHEKVQNVLGSQGILLGNWYCKDCGGKPVSCFPASCYENGHEVALVEEELTYNFEGGFYLSGHIDGYVDLKQAGKKIDKAGEGEYPLEIKTCSSSMFDYFKNGVPKWYIGQANMYMAMMRTERIIYLVIDRDNFRTFSFSYSLDENVVRDMVYKAQRIFDAVLSGDAEGLNYACTFSRSEDAKKCVFRNRCFEL